MASSGPLVPEGTPEAIVTHSNPKREDQTRMSTTISGGSSYVMSHARYHRFDSGPVEQSLACKLLARRHPWSLLQRCDPRKRRPTMVSKGGLELAKNVCSVVLWTTHSCWSEPVFASTYTYVLSSDIR